MLTHTAQLPSIWLCGNMSCKVVMSALIINNASKNRTSIVQKAPTHSFSLCRIISHVLSWIKYVETKRNLSVKIPILFQSLMKKKTLINLSIFKPEQEVKYGLSLHSMFTVQQCLHTTFYCFSSTHTLHRTCTHHLSLFPTTLFHLGIITCYITHEWAHHLSLFPTCISFIWRWIQVMRGINPWIL